MDEFDGGNRLVVRLTIKVNAIAVERGAGDAVRGISNAVRILSNKGHEFRL